MKLKISMCVTAITILAVLALPAQCLAQKLPHYTVIDLGTVGGTYSFATGITNDGLVAGQSTTLNDTYLRGFLWWSGGMIDVGTLWQNSSVQRKGVNQWGQVVGMSDTETPDPNAEDWCGFGNTICLPFLWQYGKMIPLPTLGGTNGLANAINNQGQVVGQAEFDTQDLTCLPYFALQTGAFLWQNGKIKNLPAFPGDTQGYAFALNDNGQATGGSGNCVYASHALLWQDGEVTNLGTLGGIYYEVGVSINNEGQVVGFSDLTGDATYHGFLWQKRTGMIDLGTLPGGDTSSAQSVNNNGQIVGWSCDVPISECNISAAVLFQNGVVTDLNTLIPPDSPWYLYNARGINDQGQIVGGAYNPSTGEAHAFLATPTGYAGESVTIAEPNESTQRPNVTLPENVRKLLQRRERFGGLKGELVGPQ